MFTAVAGFLDTLAEARAQLEVSAVPLRRSKRAPTTAQLAAKLHSAAARIVADLEQAIRQALTSFTPDECRNVLTAAGYDA